MNKEEKEEIITMCDDIYQGGDWQPMINYIEKLKKELEYEKELRIRYERRYDLCKESKDKLQKENELLKAPFEYAKGNTLDKRYVELNFISKDKIRNKIKELEEMNVSGEMFETAVNFAIKVLKGLL